MHRAKLGSNAYTDRPRDRTAPYQSRSTRGNDSESQRVNWCNICSFKQPYPREQLPIYHQHFSSLRLRRDILGVEEKPDTRFYCLSCKSRHRPYLDERLKVIVSDSSLHNIFASEQPSALAYEGDLVHVDYVAVRGGLIPELLQAFKHDYVDITPKKPLDVVLVGGYEDVLRGYAREFILRGMEEFARTVRACGNNSTFAVSTLMYPPKLCWFKYDGPEPYGFVNHKTKVDWINHEIDALNIRNSVLNYPAFHSYGTRTQAVTISDKHGRKVIHSKAHRWEHWEEGPRRQKYTLRLDRKFKMAKAINNYFLCQT